MKFSVASLAALYLAGTAYAGSFVGCNRYLGLPLVTPDIPSSTLAICESRCTIFDFAYWSSSTTACYCGAWGPPAGSVQSGSKDSCSGYTAVKTETTFSDAKCYANGSPDPRDASSPSSSVTSVDHCFNDCKNYRYAITKPTGLLLTVWNCKCANYPYITSGATGCTSSSYYIYNHSPGAAMSGLARRETKAAVKREQLALAANPHCPASYKACYVSEVEDDGYECIRTEAELESCGGCRFGEYESHNSTLGFDCTSIPGALPNGVTCDQGRCVVSRCRRGFRLVDGECVHRSK